MLQYITRHGDQCDISLHHYRLAHVCVIDYKIKSGGHAFRRALGTTDKDTKL